MTHDDLAMMLARLKNAIDDNRIVRIIHLVVSSQMQVVRTIARDVIVSQDAEPTASSQSRGRRGSLEGNDRINPQWLACSESAPFSDEEKR